MHVKRGNDKSSRREFLKRCARYAGSAAVAGVAGGLVIRADADKVWQLNPDLCTTCRGFTNTDGWGKCATECVLKLSAVRVVNDFTQCGYCMICPGYHDVKSATDARGIPTRFVCPRDAIVRKPVGHVDPSDPNNNFYEYTIDESKCNGCGKCVEGCRPPMGNGSLKLQVRHDLCVDCNRCAIAAACPSEAFIRVNAAGAKPGAHR